MPLQLPLPFWKVCRIVSCETRLRMLRLLVEQGEMTVSAVGREVGISESDASHQLRLLNEQGLVIFRREKMEVIYRAEANYAINFAPEVLGILRCCFDEFVSIKTVIRYVTAFTHERRIEIVKALRGRALSAPALRDATGMSASALHRHLDKLIRRGFVKESGRVYRCGDPGNTLGRALFKIAVR